MLDRIKDDKLTRVNRTGFKGTWGYTGSFDSNHPQQLLWQYHTEAQNVDAGNYVVSENNPPNQQRTSAQVSSVGSDAEPNYVITPGNYWPNSRWRLTAVNLDKYLVTDGHLKQSTAWWRFSEPLAPSISVSRSSAVLTFTINARTSDMGDGSVYDRTRTRWWLQVITGGSWPSINRYSTGGWSGSFTESSHTVTYDASTISPSRPIAVRLCAVSDGMTGASSVAVSETHVFAVPNAPTTTLSVSSGSVMANVRSNATWWRPADKLILQRQVASVRSKGGSWTNVQTVDAGTATVTGIMDGTDARIPDEDEATWYRIAAWHDAESNVAYGYVDAAALMAKPKKPTVSGTYNENDTITANVTVASSMNVQTLCKVKSGSRDITGWFVIAAGSTTLPNTFDPTVAYQLHVKNRCTDKTLDGRTRESDVTVSADIKSDEMAAAIGATLSAITIDAVSQNADGTGLTVQYHWGSEDMGTIEYDEVGTLIEWTDAPGGWISTTSPKTHKMSDGKSKSGIVSIDGLKEGTAYRIRIRRYVTVDNVDGYGPEATDVATPQSTPDQPTLVAPDTVAVGDGIPYSWTFSDAGDTAQVEARLHVGGVVHVIEGTTGSITIPTTDAEAGSTLSAWVEVTTGGGWSLPSETVTTLVAERPTATVTLAGSVTTGTTDYGGQTLTALPLTLTLAGTADSCRVTVRAAREAESPEPKGGRTNSPGQVVAYTDAVCPATVTIPSDLIIGGGAYDIEVLPRDISTGLDGDAVTTSFGVSWATPAVTPTATVTISDGEATITPAQGTGAGTETCRIWRATADGPMLCLDDAEWAQAYVDGVPPYGWDGCAYVIESVTEDGDHTWTSVAYELDGEQVTVDWQGGSVELPWSLQLSSSYSNVFERRAHMDGSRAGYWEPGTDRDWTASGNVTKGSDESLALRTLGRHDGICFVRAPEGIAFAAHADVSTQMTSSRGDLMADLSVAEVDDDGTWQLSAAGEDVG